MDKFRQMEIFTAVVETRQLTRAANILQLSKSAISHAMANLEESLGVELLTRNSRAWQLTSGGEYYYEECTKILSALEAMEDQVRHSQNLSGLIRVSSPSAFGTYALAPIVAKFMSLHPDIVIEFNLADSFIDIVEERVDLSIRDATLKDLNLKIEGLEEHTIFQTQMGIYASTKYIEKHGSPTSYTDLKNYDCIHYSPNPLWRMSKAGREYKFMPNERLKVDSGEAVRQFCIRGQGLSYIASRLVQDAVAKGALVEVLPDYDSLKMPVHALVAKDKYIPRRVTRLLEFIMTALATGSMR